MITVVVCTVIGITDGDTLRCLDSENKQIKVRVAEIDAPEKKQPFGNKSKESLSDLCFEQRAMLHISGKDRYRRAIARVECDGIDVAEHQVKAGFAWVYDKYAKTMSLYTLQDEAKAAHRGVWSQDNPVAPWRWRKK